jgi:hypothetical protein
MICKRIAMGIATAGVGLALFAGPAAAQELPGTGCSQPCPPPPSGDVLPDTQVNTDNPSVAPTPPAGEALPAVETAPNATVADTAPAAEAQTASGGLPVTGGDIAGLAGIGIAAIGTGAVLRRRGRRATVAA